MKHADKSQTPARGMSEGVSPYASPDAYSYASPGAFPKDPPRDTSPDASPDTSPDASPDASPDTSPDAYSDASLDAYHDPYPNTIPEDEAVAGVQPSDGGLPSLSAGMARVFYLLSGGVLCLLAAAMVLSYPATPLLTAVLGAAFLAALLLVVFIHTRFVAPSRLLVDTIVAGYRQKNPDPGVVNEVPFHWRPWFNMVLRIYGKLSELESELAAGSAGDRIEKNLLRRFSWVFERNEVLTEELRIKNRDLEKAVEEQQRTAMELKKHRDHLDDMVRERTADLMKTNQWLEEAIEEARIQAKKADEANQAKSQFLANVSHEVRTPLNAVIGFTDMLIDTSLDESQLDFARTIRTSSEALLALINDILDFSKIESGELELESIDFSPELLAYDVCELIRPQIGEKPIELVCKIGQEVPAYLTGDPIRYQQVLINLMTNAPKFTESGEISLNVNVMEHSEDGVLLMATVHDTGIGIEEEKRSIIFDPFRQADGSTTRKYGGTGLGLSISRKLARLMNGDIWVESEPDIGSTFYFTAWLKASAREESWKSVAAPISGKQVLVVDDNQANLDIISSALKSANVRVSDLRSGMEVVPTLERAIVAGNPYECCIIDIHMPGMSGYEVARQVRESENPKISSLPLIAASYLTERDPDLFAQAGFSQSIIKPVRRERLFEVLAQVAAGQEGVPMPSPMPAAPPSETDKFAGFHILVAEDNAVNQKLIDMMLKKVGCTVTLAENGREAVDIFTDAPDDFDLVFMDIQMPEMDGFEALKILRQEGHTGIPIVAMTAHAMKEHRDECLAAGMNAYLSKPIRKPELHGILGQFLIQSRF